MSGLSPSNQNLLFGKGILTFRKVGTTKWQDFGEVPKFEIENKVETEKKYSSRSGTNLLFLEFEKSREATAAFELIEYTPENLDKVFVGDGVQEASQVAGQIDALSVTLEADGYVDIGSNIKHGLTYKKITHGAVTGNTFAIGETVTGGTSAQTAKVARVGDGFLEVIHDTGLQANEVITGGTSAATATTAGIESMAGAVVMPASQVGARTAVGTPTGTNLPTIAGTCPFWGNANIEFRVKITAVGPDKFQYSLDGGTSWNGTSINCAATPVYCAKGISVTWVGTTGGVLNDEWKWAVTARYQPGVDYDVIAGAGMIRKRSAGGIGASAVVSADYPLKTLRSIRGLAGSSVRGALRFIGNPDQGPKWYVQVWDVLITVGGAAAFISDDTAPIPMNASFQKDETNHPSEPFFRATEIA